MYGNNALGASSYYYVNTPTVAGATDTDALIQWLTYWEAVIEKAQTVQEIAQVQNAANSDLDAQGVTDPDLLTYARNHIQSMANVRAYNLSLWSPGPGYEVTPQPGDAAYTPPTVTTPVQTQCEPEAVVSWQDIYANLASALPALQRDADAGIIGAVATLEAARRQLAEAESALLLCGGEIPTDIPEWIDPHAAPDVTVTTASGPRFELNLSPIGKLLMAGALYLVLIPGKRR